MTGGGAILGVDGAAKDFLTGFLTALLAASSSKGRGRKTAVILARANGLLRPVGISLKRWTDFVVGIKTVATCL
jgi:hypothetical protein